MIRIARHFLDFQKLFYQYAGWRLLALYVVIAFGGIVEVVGIVSLLPLLSAVTNDAAGGGLSQIVTGFLRRMGIEPSLSSMLLLIVVIFAVRGLLVYSHTFIAAQIMVTVRRNVQVKLTQRFCEMNFTYYKRRSTGWFNNIIVGEVARFVSSLRTFSRLAVSIIETLIFLPFVLSLRFELTLAVLAIGGLVLWSLKGFVRGTARLSQDQTRNAGQLNAEFIQLIQSFIYLKATNSMAAASRHVIQAIERFTDNELRIKRTASLFESIKEPIAVAALAAFIYIEVAVLKGSLPEIVVVALLLYRTLMQIIALAPQLQTFNQTIGGVYAVENIARDLDKHSEQAGGRAVQARDRIVFRDVNFSYGDSQILRDVNLVMNPNETVGIVGPSGAGKTTVFHLLTGLLEPSSGAVEIGGVPYSDIDKPAFRARIGYVTQEPIIFNDTVANNISFWRCKEHDFDCLNRVQEASVKAKCHDFVRAMPGGYDAKLGDRGINLSGGERQRIAIARELFKSPEILIFDEAASALDADAERYVQDSIDRMHGERTVVVITHRLASVRHCDRIYVLESGRVVEEGTFDGLFANPGSYFRRMCDQQGVSA